MELDTYSRRTLLAATGAAFASGCTSLLDPGPSERLPVLVSLAVANDTDRERAYRVRVQFAADAGGTPETVHRSDGTVPARERANVGGDWPRVPGRHVVGVSVDGGDWSTWDLAGRLTQADRICYRVELSIGGDGVTAAVDVNAPCPDG